MARIKTLRLDRNQTSDIRQGVGSRQNEEMLWIQGGFECTRVSTFQKAVPANQDHSNCSEEPIGRESQKNV
ncbi:MAG TPA: hypothetical protein DHW22_06915 [Planctomycetaceae bacterium]|nr:hypothetical protein [Planctomycetaceae bacterium]